MTIEARLAFIAFFLICWSLLGLIPWALAAVWRRGRGAILALPLALAGACAGGVLVPLLGRRDLTGFLISLLTALVGSGVASAAGIAISRRIAAARPAPPRPPPGHPIGARRPEPDATASPPPPEPAEPTPPAES
jgi:uncharacterized membrane protein YeaQ/YmgE (transglycosylase-associated protein family)